MNVECMKGSRLNVSVYGKKIDRQRKQQNTEGKAK